MSDTAAIVSYVSSLAEVKLWNAVWHMYYAKLA
jgi:hypothetical protein